MVIYNALDLKKGKTSDDDLLQKYNSHVQPVQMLMDSEKDDMWKVFNMDWLENVGLAQIRTKATRLTKNYKLAVGKIDKSDYIVAEGNNYKEVVDFLTKEDESALEIKFYPIIPPVINILLGEFSKRNSRPIVKAIDDFSFNEALDQKRQLLMQSLVEEAKQKIMEASQQQIPEDQLNQQVMSLPQIEQFMRKTYKGLVEEWAAHQLAYDEERFRLYELESIAFSDALISGTEFWHISMRENDYDVEVWNPRFTFYHKSPDVRYVSQGNYVGNIQLMSVSDIIDRFGYLMNEEQVKSLETNYPNINRGLIADGREFTEYYDPTIKHDAQIPANNLWFNKEVSRAMYYNQLHSDDLFYNLNNIETDFFERQGFVRVTQAYWRSKKWVALLTSIDESGQVTTDWVDETFEVTEQPIYDNNAGGVKSKDTLLYGQHLDCIWINETYKGIKIGSSNSAIYGRATPGFSPLYIDVKPLPFQLKGDYSIYGSRLPVEGCAFSDRNTSVTSLVDLMKPFQIAFNIVNNQISDILIDELGSIIILDQNTLPKHSMGETWERGNLAKAYIAMKNFQMLPLDHTLDNTEERINYNQHTVLDMSQTQRLLGRIELAKYFKEEAFASVGISAQRLGEVTASETATGTSQAVNNSYAQTEMYFVKHINFLMPRLKEALLNVAQYYHSTKETVPLTYTTSSDEREFFEIEGTKLLARDFGVFCTQKPDVRAALDQLKQLAIQNNTSGASLYDLAQILQSDSPAQVVSILKQSQEKMQQQQQSEQTMEQQLQQEQLQHQEQMLQEQQAFQAQESEKDRQERITEAEIRASAMANTKGGNVQGIEESKTIADNYFKQEELAHKDRQLATQQNLDNKKLQLEKEKMASNERIENTKLKVAKQMHSKDASIKKQQINSKPKPKK